MIIVVAKSLAAAQAQMKRGPYCGPYTIVSPRQFHRIRGILASGLHVGGGVRISAEEGYYLESCFSLMPPEEQGPIFKTIHGITEGGKAAIDQYVSALLSRDEQHREMRRKAGVSDA
jgi:hypothetical protein